MVRNAVPILRSVIKAVSTKSFHTSILISQVPQLMLCPHSLPDVSARLSFVADSASPTITFLYWFNLLAALNVCALQQIIF